MAGILFRADHLVQPSQGGLQHRWDLFPSLSAPSAVAQQLRRKRSGIRWRSNLLRNPFRRGPFLQSEGDENRL